MNGLSLVTKGYITPSNYISIIPDPNPTSTVGGGSPPVFRDENLPKPFIKVEGVSITGNKKESFTEETIKVKTVKIIDAEKD
jgi:hypothetical protein